MLDIQDPFMLWYQKMEKDNVVDRENRPKDKKVKETAKQKNLPEEHVEEDEEKKAEEKKDKKDKKDLIS